MYYLKYRPKTISDIDNTRVKDIFKNILSNTDSLPHALLFIGQKGTGKTSMARIFAKAVNCESNIFSGKNKSIEPCNTCSGCLSIDSSSCPDVLEMDAASNRGIEDVKNLIRETAFLPMTARYRVFIIDEAHMITNDAFNALLKTLEEPPKNVIFILATTNQEKIPKTIASRCTLVNFGKAKTEDIVHMLTRIATNEKLKTDPALLTMISGHSDQSFRDAAKLFEELVTQKKLTKEEAELYLGVARTSLLDVLASSDSTQALAWIQSFSQTNGSFKVLIESLLTSLHEALLQSKGIKTEENNLKVNFSLSDIIRLMKLLTEAYQQMKITPVESIPLEIAIVEFYNHRNKVQ